jgi:hypothetical protein
MYGHVPAAFSADLYLQRNGENLYERLTLHELAWWTEKRINMSG